MGFLDRYGIHLLIVFVMVFFFFIGRWTVEPEVRTEIKTVKIQTQPKPTTTTTFVGVQCMVNGAVIKTDMAHAEEAGCQ